MRVCPTCGEVYPTRTQRCAAHDIALVEWSGGTDVVDIRDTDTPFEIPAVAGELTTVALDEPVHSPGDTPKVVVREPPQPIAPRSRPRILGGRYRLGKQLGVGGYGVVFAAEDTRSGDRVAIKLLSPAATQSEELIKRFQREAIAASSVHHRNIVDVIDFDVDDDTHYIVMEYLDGRDLSNTLDAERRLAPIRALLVVGQCARALAAAHRAGILHRDLKPANVFLVQHTGQREVVKIIDFGISKLTLAAGNYSDLTSASKVVGTPCYMSPEQARGASLDGRCDVYGLGVMLFEVLVGERPFTGRSPIEILGKHRYAPRVAPSTIRPELGTCPGLDDLVVKALAPDPDNRHQSMEVFGEAIVECLRAIDPAVAELVDQLSGELDGSAVDPVDPPDRFDLVPDEVTALVDTTQVNRAHPNRRRTVAIGAMLLATSATMIAWRLGASQPLAAPPGDTRVAPVAATSPVVPTPARSPSIAPTSPVEDPSPPVIRSTPEVSLDAPRPRAHPIKSDVHAKTPRKVPAPGAAGLGVREW